MPVAVRQFSRIERLLIRTPVYASTGTPIVNATLASGFGAPMRALTVNQGPGASVYEIDLPLASLAAGSYVVDVRAKAGDHEAKETLSFRVTP